nr:hypothetical protein [Flavobacterium sp.]
MMEELDLLKKDWKRNENSYQQISEVDIYKMLHKKSSSIVKWILVISVLEVIVWTAISFFFNADQYLIEMHGESFIVYFRYLTILNYFVVAVFIYMFYKNYKNISTVTSTKKLMQDILKTRKTVKYYVWYNLAMIVVCSIIAFAMALYMNPQMSQITNNNKAFAITICVMVLFITLFVGLFWLFYRLIYGTLLRRLFRNYNELKKIDL